MGKHHIIWQSVLYHLMLFQTEYRSYIYVITSRSYTPNSHVSRRFLAHGHGEIWDKSPTRFPRFLRYKQVSRWRWTLGCRPCSILTLFLLCIFSCDLLFNLSDSPYPWLQNSLWCRTIQLLILCVAYRYRPISSPPVAQRRDHTVVQFWELGQKDEKGLTSKGKVCVP